MTVGASSNPLSGFINLFFDRKKFTSHRILGLSFLVQYVYVIYLYAFDYRGFLRSYVTVTMPLTGVLQAVNASLTFTFLPKHQVDGGYFSYRPGML
jgi:hypothetical protein